MNLVIVTGMSGAGKSTAMKMMEDMGYFCVDNLPVEFFDKFVDLFSGTTNMTKKNIALGMDVRSGDALDVLKTALDHLDRDEIHYEILYLDASDNILVKRYKETRRIHPLSNGERIEKGLERERQKIGFLRERADYILDTSTLLTRELKTELERIFIHDEEYKNMMITILSFGFKYGIPADSDMVMDVRFLPNPYYDVELRPKTGNDIEIQEFVMKSPEASVFVDKLEDLVQFLIPQYIDEGKNQLVISIGCTGGKHRSVTLANELFKRLDGENREYGLKIEHRDLTKDALRGK
ncbi:MAG: RNase adapter RapZ [Agathobacter sp.]|nr:RNase adapter RapZ [Agathobacter sp.]